MCKVTIAKFFERGTIPNIVKNVSLQLSWPSSVQILYQPNMRRIVQMDVKVQEILPVSVHIDCLSLSAPSGIVNKI